MHEYIDMSMIGQDKLFKKMHCQDFYFETYKLLPVSSLEGGI